MLATQVILSVTIIGNIALLCVVLRERPSIVRGTFAFYIAALTGWTLAIFLNLFLQSIFVEEFIFATAALSLTSQVWFARMVTEQRSPNTLLGYWPIVIGGFFFFVSFYPHALFNTIRIHPHGYTILDNGFLSAEYSLFALIFVCAPIVILFLKYRAATEPKTVMQLKYLTIGFSMFAVVVVFTNSILPVFFHIYELNAIGPAFSLVFATFVFYIIWNYGFLDIRRALQRGGIYSFLIAIIVVVYAMLLIIGERLLSHTGASGLLDDDVVQSTSAGIVIIVGAYTLPYIERRFQRLTDRLFFKDRYDYAQSLESLSAILRDSTDFDQLIDLTQYELSRIFRADSVSVLLHEQQAAPDSSDRYATRLASREMLFESIRIGDEVIGAILVGEKRSGDTYTMQDIRLLHTFSMQAATAFARANLFRQVQAHAVQLEEKVLERTEELRRSQERERHMMQDIAHGLQTPLAVFRTKLETLKDIGASDMGALDRSLADLSDFVQNLLQLARLEHTENVPDAASCDLSDLMFEIAEEVAVVAIEDRIWVTNAIKQDIRVRGDKKELRTAMLNLAGNSIKYMRRDGVREIAFTLEHAGTDAKLTIRDTGIGIPPASLSQIFERFYRDPGSNTTGGGLGLAITKRIIERHGGSIGIESSQGSGTTVTIRLPCLT